MSDNTFTRPADTQPQCFDALSRLRDTQRVLVEALEGLMEVERRGRVMPIGAAWDAARAALASVEEQPFHLTARSGEEVTARDAVQIDAAVDGVAACAPGSTDAERAAWLADKIGAMGDYAKEAAAMLRRWPTDGVQAVAPLAWERRQGLRCRDGWSWSTWQPCTEAEAQRVTGLHSWQVRQTGKCRACAGTGRVPSGAPACLCGQPISDECKTNGCRWDKEKNRG